MSALTEVQAQQNNLFVPKKDDHKPMHRLIQDLHQHFEQFGNGIESAKRVGDVMSNYITNNTDWKEYAHFHPSFYARNLIELNEHFEIMVCHEIDPVPLALTAESLLPQKSKVLCWKDGQKSPIHNHAESSCWMGCLEGQIEETYYHVKDEPETGPEEGICPNLIKGKTETHSTGEIAYIRDEIALHVIRPLEGDAASLHLYAPPIRSCLTYIPALGKTVRKKVGYYTLNGERCNEIALLS